VGAGPARRTCLINMSGLLALQGVLFALSFGVLVADCIILNPITLLLHKFQLFNNPAAMLRSIVFLAVLTPSTCAFSIPPLRHLDFLGAASAQKQQQPLQDTLDAWIQQEERIALDKLLDNVSPGGRTVEGHGVAPGTVVASPSQDGPDYWYQCKSI
jgi:hypothetical protein